MLYEYMLSLHVELSRCGNVLDILDVSHLATKLKFCPCEKTKFISDSSARIHQLGSDGQLAHRSDGCNPLTMKGTNGRRAHDSTIQFIPKVKAQYYCTLIAFETKVRVPKGRMV